MKIPGTRKKWRIIITLEEMLKISQLVNNQTKLAVGPNYIPKKGISTIVICFPTIAADIFTASLCHGKFPAAWKAANFKTTGIWWGGVPNGSILGPLLWIFAFDKALRKRLPARTIIVHYGNDIFIITQRYEMGMKGATIRKNRKRSE